MTKKSADESITPEEIFKEAKAENIMMIHDSKFGKENYVSVQCSWPQMIRFARRMIKIGRGK